MNPSLASLCLLVCVLAAAYAVTKRVRLLWLEAPEVALPTNHVARRLRRVLREALLQVRLRNERAAGLAHFCVFIGFWLLLPRTVVLIARAFEPAFASPSPGVEGACAWMLTQGYAWVRAGVALVVAGGVGVFVYLRLVRRISRFRRTAAAHGLLAAIATMMLADFAYDAAGFCLAAAYSAGQWTAPAVGTLAQRFVAPFVVTDLLAAEQSLAIDPLTAAIVAAIGSLGEGPLLWIGIGGYLLHVGLVLTLLVALPYTKHFHLFTAWPNLFFDALAPSGQIETRAKTPERLLEMVEASLQEGAASAVPGCPLGKASLRDFSPKERLSLFACTECGRCTSHCPATRSGQPLDPRQVTLDLRDLLVRAPRGATAKEYMAQPLVPSVLRPEALWACTTCGACEEQCPVGVRIVGPIVDLRRDLLLMRGEAPPTLQRLFDGLERQRNPWNSPNRDRAQWTEGLGVELLKDVEQVEYLYWVGCAASFDGRTQAVARALVRLMQKARVSFAILGPEESCTGDAARRAGNELLYLQLAQRNIELLDRYRAEGRFQRIVTTCPHCLVALGNDYRALGGDYDVVSHAVAIEGWLTTGRLEALPGSGDLRLAYHDPCTLARGCGITEAPRRALALLPGVRMIEPAHHGVHTACCGAGGAGMWLETEGNPRPSRHRLEELERTDAAGIVSACPFCRTMLADAQGAQATGARQPIQDLAEVVDARCRQGDTVAGRP